MTLLVELVVALAGAGSLLTLGLLIAQSRPQREKVRSSIARSDHSATERLLRDAGLPTWLNHRTWPIVRLGAVVLGVAIGWPLMGHILVLPGIMLGLFGPTAVVRIIMGRRQRKLSQELNEILQSMITLLASGSTMLEALQQLATTFAPENYRPTFLQLADDYRTQGQVFALTRAQASVNNPMFDRFVGYLRINAELGAELIPLLKDAQVEIRKQTAMAGRLAILSNQTKLAGLGIPIGFGGLILGIQLLQGGGSYWAPYFSFPGNLVELFGYGMFFAGGWTIMRLQRIPPQDRMIYGPGARWQGDS